MSYKTALALIQNSVLSPDKLPATCQEAYIKKTELRMTLGSQ